MRRGFTMIELVFVIVILGILASIAIPRLAASRDDARAVSVKQDISTLSQAVAAWYQSQNDVSIENAMQFDLSVWKRTGATAEYIFEDAQQGKVIAKLIAKDINDTASNITGNEGALTLDTTTNSVLPATVGAGNVPWLYIELQPAPTNTGVVYMLVNNLKVANETKVPMAGMRVKWDN